MMGLAPNVAPSDVNGAYVLLDLIGTKRAAEYRERLDALVAARDEANAAIEAAAALEAEAAKKSEIAHMSLEAAQKLAQDNADKTAALREERAAVDADRKAVAREIVEFANASSAKVAELDAREKAVKSREKRLDEAEAIAAQRMKAAEAKMKEADAMMEDMRKITGRRVSA